MLENKMEVVNVDEVIEKFEAITKDVEKVQNETLKKILEENGSAEYLQSLGLNGRTDPESFKNCIPLCTHQNLEPFIQRIADGDTSPILTGKPITTISLSSGTTQGKPKFIPFTDQLLDNTLQIFRTSFAFRNREFPLGNGKALEFIFSSKQGKTKGGLAVGTATTNLYRNPYYKYALEELQFKCCSPTEVIFGSDFHQSLYCHLLCGLIFREDIQFLFSSFAHSIVLAFRTFEQVWEELCNDLQSGVLSSRVTSPSIRAAMSQLLKPNAQLADLLRNKCSGLSNWYGLIPELFPNAKYVYGIMTGSMEPYLKKLRHYAGELPLLSADYGASEGWIGANVNPLLPPELATFAVVPDIGYFEFIPLRDNGECIYTEPKPVGLADVKIGEEYEIIVTNYAGLYRYRLGDIVKVMGFHNKTPELKFVCRRSLLLTVNIDKNTEKDLQLAVEEAVKPLAEEKLELVDFSSLVDRSSEPGHYVIFWEISGEPTGEALQECCNCLDKSFIDAGYVSSRKIRSIGPLELRVVDGGTFQKILDHFLGLGAAVSQFKTPRCIGPSNKMVLQILNDNVVKSYFSTAY
ncbi:jasmonoyl--L-amino acid synthetase JAR4 [Mercurialis annua]|uniref:jasmonoyl--L-amino acid synthetase JAR4 n=1 Tax=Mercurialis annua TaxID=3986 RepID=UPI00215FAC54|nr:jasmonoyl--L-amino acid synthetase JAR4 [Mercurialis annua]XP_050237757.1 jasmonoyl--L-amino acid synthetase JAR4 [Mercurialis annua]XP_050237760.1 jasmonoyl--L-amino acid synthetase JAR4 [Mercurialis annua]XP_050237761.1 jasmonoyl--L-amino acid synthetase JAR4 [Mercurialis annua]XP_050237762.1 jasmonoyl--L-amino acid synthetase JAR4 [Mercurialis annua]XP_050237763.1 jasmonoyl--L-amino acid synthetase JAR4 [Mercurialis annua]